jgi:hypothetical protein
MPVMSPAIRSTAVVGSFCRAVGGCVGERAVGECCDGVLVLAALALESGERTEAARSCGMLLRVATPGAGQGQQPQGVSDRGGVEQDSVVLGCRVAGEDGVNSLNAAISIVQAPESCSCMVASALSGRTPR